MVYPRRIAWVVRAFEYGARGHGIQSMATHNCPYISFFITCTSQLVYILMIYIHLILRTCMSSKGWSRGTAFEYAAGGHSIDAQTLHFILKLYFYNMHNSIGVYFNDLYTFNFSVPVYPWRVGREVWRPSMVPEGTVSIPKHCNIIF